MSSWRPAPRALERCRRAAWRPWFAPRRGAAATLQRSSRGMTPCRRSPRGGARVAGGGGDAPEVLEVDDALQAVAQARRKVGEHGLVVVAGSMFLVGDVRAAMLGEIRDPVITSDPAPVATARRS